MYERLPYDFPVGERISRLLFGVGTGLHFRSGKGKIDVAVQVGKEGSIDTNQLENRIFRLYVGVSGSEVWKRKRQRKF